MSEEDPRRQPVLQLLGEMYLKQPRIGYMLLYFLKVRYVWLLLYLSVVVLQAGRQVFNVTNQIVFSILEDKLTFGLKPVV